MIINHNQEMDYNDRKTNSESSVDEGMKKEPKEKEARIDMWKEIIEDVKKLLNPLEWLVDVLNYLFGYTKKIGEGTEESQVRTAVFFTGIFGMCTATVKLFSWLRKQFLYGTIYNVNTEIVTNDASIPMSFLVGVIAITIVAVIVAISIWAMIKFGKKFAQKVEKAEKSFCKAYTYIIAIAVVIAAICLIPCVFGIITSCVETVNQILENLFEPFLKAFDLFAYLLKYPAVVIFASMNVASFLIFQAPVLKKEKVHKDYTSVFVAVSLFLLFDLTLTKNLRIANIAKYIIFNADGSSVIGQKLLGLAKGIIEHQALLLLFALIVVTGIYINYCMCFGRTKKRNSLLRLTLICLLTVSVLYRYEDIHIRTTPYAVICDTEQEEIQESGIEYVQVIAYQNETLSVLERATIETFDNGICILTIDTSQQETVDSTSLSYEYQLFYFVVIE